MPEFKALQNDTRQVIYESSGTISRSVLYSKFDLVCTQLSLSKYEYDEKIAKPIYDEYDRTIQSLIQQVKEYLTNENREVGREEIYNRFLNDCGKLFLSEGDFYKRVLKKSALLVEGESLSQAEKEQKHATTKKLNEELNTQSSKIPNFDAYSDWLIKIAFEDGILESDEIQKILTKAEDNNFDTNIIINKVQQKLIAENYKSYPKASLDAKGLKENLLSTNWYSEPKYNTIKTPPPPSIIGPHDNTSRLNSPEGGNLAKKKKPVIQVAIFISLILASLVFLVLLFTMKDKRDEYNKWYSCYLDGYFYGLIGVVILSFVIFHKQFRDLRKPPFYLRISLFFVTICFFVLPFLFERYGKALDDYDQNLRSGFHWAWPSNILKYPLENLKLTNIDDSTYNSIILPKNLLDSTKEKNRTYIITIIDKTLSGNANPYITRLGEQERLRLISSINETAYAQNIFDSLELRDLLALYINIDSSRPFDQRTTSSTYIFNGIDSGQYFTIDDDADRNMNYKKKYLDHYLPLRSYTDGIKRTSRNKGRTNFSLFCDLVVKDLETKKNSNPDFFKGANISLNIISDFYHEVIDLKKVDSVINYFKVDKSISDLLHIIGNNLSQINLYKLPLSSGSQNEAVDSLLNIFTITCDKIQPRVHNIEFYLSSNISCTTSGLLIPATDTWEGNSVQFTYKNRDAFTKAISKIEYSGSNLEDTLTCCLVDKTLLHNNNKDYYKIYHRINNAETEFAANINSPFILNGFKTGNNLFISMEKNHIKDDALNFSFELYSKKLKKKFHLPVEFRMPGSNTINYFLFLFEAVAYLSIVLLFLLIFHKINLAILFDSGYLTTITSALSFFALILPISVSLLYFNKFISQYNIDIALKIACYLLIFIVYGLTFISYRHNNSKFINQTGASAQFFKTTSLFCFLLFDKKATNN